MNLNQIAAQIRFDICRVSQQTKTPHLGSCLSCVDLLTALYWQELRVKPELPDWSERDIFMLSKGHAASALYTTLAHRGYFDIAKIFEHGQDGTRFEEHPGVHAPAGVEVVSGSLGHSLSLATGMALSHRIQNSDKRFYVLMGDGELNEGTVWEAAMFAAGQKLSNLVALVDFNKLQGTGESCNIMHLEPLQQKWAAFGWHCIRINGHDIDEINAALEEAKAQDKPVCIVADTVKGKGISFMEDDNNWHYRIPTEDEVALAKEELGIS